jgi:hypothetical protein
LGLTSSSDAAIDLRALTSTSTSKWPALARTAPSFMTRKCSAVSTLTLPVHVMNMSPTLAAAMDPRTS